VFRLLSWLCPQCHKPLHIELEVSDPPTLAYHCQCPRCNHRISLPGGNLGVAHDASTPWALRATPVE